MINWKQSIIISAISAHYHNGSKEKRICSAESLSAAIWNPGSADFVEADVSEGLPGIFPMVGDLSAKVKEAQDRVMTAFRNSGIQLRPKRITVNLSPADIYIKTAAAMTSR